MENSQTPKAFDQGNFPPSTGQNVFGSKSSVFGSSPSQFGSQANLFGSVVASSSSPTSPVGSVSNSTSTTPFGNVTGSSSSVVFGKTTTSSSSTPFGNTSTSLSRSPFGSVPAISTNSPFGSVPASSTNSPFGSVPTTSTNSPFGSVPATSTNSPFGSVPATSTNSPFGSVPASSTNSPFGNVTTNLFGNVPVSSSNSVIGSQVISPSSTSSPGALFGKSGIASTSSGLFASQPAVFGAVGKKDDPQNSALFQSKINEAGSSSSQFLQNKAGSELVFGGSLKKDANISPPFSASSNQTSLLFGKPQPPGMPATSGTSSLSLSDNAKVKTSSMLFGKSVNVSSSSSSLSTAQSTSQSSGELFSSRVGAKNTGLFGSSASSSNVQEDGNGAEDTEGAYNFSGSPKKSIGRWKSSSKTTTTSKQLVRKLLTSSLSRSTENTLSDDAAPSKSLVIRNIPPQYCDRDILKEHFSQCGKVMLIRVTPDKCTAAITFDSKDSALRAKEATTLDNENPPMDIFFRSSLQVGPKRSITKIAKDPRRKTLSRDAEEELKSMAEIPEFETDPVPFQKGSSPKPQRTNFVRQRSPTPPPARRSSPTPHIATVSVPQDNMEPQGPPDIDTVKGLLKSLYQAKALDTNGRIAILDKRDMLLKLLRGRQQSDLASAKAFKGTCPDMCPEKERYYREETRRLALYEIILSTMSNVAGLKTKVDHTKAVKEYSRSSADQKEPFPHELRPLSVLQSTMVYLLANVADEGGDGKWSEWYDFLWNRTRGIRKEITQQQLCHLEVAHLIERCVRFHIFCAEPLCEEDMMTFDAKINDENLTKCLQTLKELYEDLEIKHSCYCPNEAEIRSYIVLMNINQGDTLREIQQLRPEIRESPYIRFAVEVYNAVNSSNYVRFFRLIKKTTFLNSCILHRYFNQIRSRALRIIKKSMATQGKSLSYPVDEMIRLLCFENASEVVEFCAHYGLQVKGPSIILDGTSFVEPEGHPPQRRSITLVESKRAVSVGETIYGGPLPALNLPEPHSSFDASGLFVFSPEFMQALMAGGLKIPAQIGEVLSKGVATTDALPVALPVAVSQKLPLARDVAKVSYSNEAIKSFARSLILEETDGQAVSIAQDVLQEARVEQACVEGVLMEILTSAVTENIKRVATEVVEEEERELRQALEVASQRQQCVAKVSASLMDEVLNALVKDVTKEEWKLVVEERHHRFTLRCGQACADSLVEAVVMEQIHNVASEVHQVDVVAKRERLTATETQILFRKMHRYFQLWRKTYVSRLRVKRAMEDFPVAPSSRSSSQQLSALIPNRPAEGIKDSSFYVGERAKLTVRNPMDSLYRDLHLSASLSMASAQRMLSGLQVWQPLDIGVTTGNQLASLIKEWKECNLIDQATAYLQWKLVLSTPGQKLDDETDFVDWVKAKLKQDGESNHHGGKKKAGSSEEGEIVSKCTMYVMPSKMPALSLSFCVRCFHGNWTDDQAVAAGKSDVLKGMNGLVFITTDADRFLAEEAFWRKDRRRLKQLLTKKPKHPAVPLVVVIPRLSPETAVSRDILDHHLELTSLHGQGLLSAVHFAQPYVPTNRMTIESNTQWTQQLSNCLCFLASRISPPPSLAVKSLSDFVEDGVVEYYKTTVYQDLRTRTRLQLIHQSPNTLLSLYNDIIDHMGMVIASDTLTTCSWPAPEFDHQAKGLKSAWNSPDHLCDLYEVMAKLRLPFFRYSDMEVEDWEVACRDIWKYVEAVTRKDSGSAKICLYQKVVDLLHTAKKRFDQFCWLASEDGSCEPTYVNMTWTDLIDACIHYKMVSLRTGHFRVRRHEEEKVGEELEEDDFEDIDVYYHQSELDDYEVPSVWQDALRDTETVASIQVKKTVVKISGVKRSRQETEPVEEELVVKKSRNDKTNLQKDKENTAKSPESFDPALQNLSNTCFDMIQREREASRKFEELLTSAVNNPGNISSSLLENSLAASALRHSYLDHQDSHHPSVPDRTPRGKPSQQPLTRQQPLTPQQPLIRVVTSDPALNTLSKNCFDLLEREREETEKFEKLLQSLVANPNPNPSPILPPTGKASSSSSSSSRFEQNRHRLAYPGATPKSKYCL